MGFQIQNGIVGLVLAEGLQQSLADINHEKGEISGIGNGGFFDIHEVFQPPVLFGIAEMKLDLKAEGVQAEDLSIGLFQIGTEEDGVGLDMGHQIGFQDDNHIEGKGELLVVELALIDVVRMLSWMVVSFRYRGSNW